MQRNGLAQVEILETGAFLELCSDVRDFTSL